MLCQPLCTFSTTFEIVARGRTHTFSNSCIMDSYTGYFLPHPSFRCFQAPFHDVQGATASQGESLLPGYWSIAYLNQRDTFETFMYERLPRVRQRRPVVDFPGLPPRLAFDHGRPFSAGDPGNHTDINRSPFPPWSSWDRASKIHGHHQYSGYHDWEEIPVIHPDEIEEPGPVTSSTGVHSGTYMSSDYSHDPMLYDIARPSPEMFRGPANAYVNRAQPQNQNTASPCIEILPSSGSSSVSDQDLLHLTNDDLFSNNAPFADDDLYHSPSGPAFAPTPALHAPGGSIDATGNLHHGFGIAYLVPKLVEAFSREQKGRALRKRVLSELAMRSAGRVNGRMKVWWMDQARNELGMDEDLLQELNHTLSEL